MEKKHGLSEIIKNTSVLPKPTSPQMRRSIGLPPSTMSSRTSANVECWSSVGSYSNPASKASIRLLSGAHGVRCRLFCRAAAIARRSAATLKTFLAAFAFRLWWAEWRQSIVH